MREGKETPEASQLFALFSLSLLHSPHSVHYLASLPYILARATLWTKNSGEGERDGRKGGNENHHLHLLLPPLTKSLFFPPALLVLPDLSPPLCLSVFLHVATTTGQSLSREEFEGRRENQSIEIVCGSERGGGWPPMQRVRLSSISKRLSIANRGGDAGKRAEMQCATVTSLSSFHFVIT